jgi:hypothetical protein
VGQISDLPRNAQHPPTSRKRGESRATRRKPRNAAKAAPDLSQCAARAIDETL